MSETFIMELNWLRVIENSLEYIIIASSRGRIEVLTFVEVTGVMSFKHSSGSVKFSLWNKKKSVH